VIFRDQQAFDRLNAQGSFKFSLQRRPFNPYDLHWVRERKLLSVDQIGIEHMLEDLGGPPAGEEREPKPSLSQLQAELEVKRLPPRNKKTSRPTTDSKITTHEFEVKVEPWKGSHRSYLERTTYWGPFRVVPSIMQQHLSKVVPVLGLSDVEVHRQPANRNISYRKSQELANAKTLKELYESSQGLKLA
jgi:hypothetical protein